MWISILLSVVMATISFGCVYYLYTWKFKQVKAPESVYRRAVNWGWELANKLKNHRQYTDDEIFETFNELEQWKFYIRNIPVPERSGLKAVQGDKK